ncbi:antiterminator LoaP [Paenibacillus sp. chi10]|uniref:Antiterminator LoaP n=1 Tax=Paenibacillus suaedae TaxID=3077233 RepID=A0AAJ2JXE7_9BACL|nr:MULTISPECIES: antiterminator LoaP [unclassified Paenibacillus]MDT8977509.1 antiterminator LoaP [Paenibacillus sp. chi10]GAV14727.1 transcription antitermination protein NusG [Paenibacillus sp. NAIST15-1]
MGWYALFVETGSEDIVQKCLKSQFGQADLYSCVPKRLVPEKRDGEFYSVVKTLFPGYLLIHTKMTPTMYYELKKIPKYYRLLRNSTFMLDKVNRRAQKSMEPFLEVGHPDNNCDDFFNEIDEGEIRQILQLINHENIIEYSNVIVEDSKVCVQSGPLYGLEGMIKKIDKRKRRAQITISFSGGERLIDVGIEILMPDRHDMGEVNENLG